MQCRLCQKTSELRNSHIIPEFFYKQLYDHLNRFRVIPTDATERERFLQKGIREKLLCDLCEQRFSRWEKYANESFVEGNGLTIVQLQRGILLQGLNYTKFKLFLMSVLWRMGVSSLDYFKEVRLGCHEQILRQALLNDDPLDELQYGCVFIGVSLKGKVYVDWMLAPTLVKANGQHCYRTLINGILFCFFVSKQPPPANFKDVVLKKNGELLFLLDDVANIPFLQDAVQKIGHGLVSRRNLQS